MTRTIDFFFYPGCVALDVVGPHEVFALASGLTLLQSGTPAYSLRRIGWGTREVRTASGLCVVTEHVCSSTAQGHTLILPGGLLRGGHVLIPGLIQWLSEHARHFKRIASVCTGAFYLAEAGLLNGRQATTHWASAAHFAQMYPEVDLQPDSIFEQSEHVWTSAGVSAGIDLALAMVERDCGHAIALDVARELVVFLRRPGGQSQFSTHMRHDAAQDDRIATIQGWVADHLAQDLRVQTLAARAHMSPRHFARVFRAQTKMTPAAFVERCRVEAVRNALESSSTRLSALAEEVGFSSAEVLRRVFRRHFGVSPSVYRASIHRDA